MSRERIDTQSDWQWVKRVLKIGGAAFIIGAVMLAIGWNIGIPIVAGAAVPLINYIAVGLLATGYLVGGLGAAALVGGAVGAAETLIKTRKPRAQA